MLMSKFWKAMGMILSIIASILILIYFFLVYKAFSALKQIERLNDMITHATLNNGFLNLEFNPMQSLNIFQFGTINRYTDEIARIYKYNFNLDTCNGISFIDKHNTRTIIININPDQLIKDSKLEKKCIEKNEDFTNIADQGEKQTIVFSAVRETMQELGAEFLQKEKEMSIFLKPFNPVRRNLSSSKIHNPLEFNIPICCIPCC